MIENNHLEEEMPADISVLMNYIDPFDKNYSKELY